MDLADIDAQSRDVGFCPIADLRDFPTYKIMAEAVRL
jgi:hypothetical protein